MSIADPIQTVAGPNYELGFPRPTGATGQIFEDEVGKYICLTWETYMDLRRQAFDWKHETEGLSQ
jgi:hypothetical protein